MSAFAFEIIHRSKRSKARVGRITTAHGPIDTPAFVAVGTNGTLKALDTSVVNASGLQLMFCNTYHLLLQPGADLIKKAGGLHQFMGRTGPIITDSGGFQVFSLAYGSVTSELKSKGKRSQEGCVLKITEEGVLFRSYRDGSKVLLTPESSVQAQKDLGADIIIPLDELPPYHISNSDLKASLERTHRWEKRSLDVHLKDRRGQAIYAVVHGGVDPAMRRESCDALTDLPFDGYAIGGSVGKDKPEMYEVLDVTMPRLPDNKPTHLLGIGDLASLQGAIPRGVDTFDSSYPTRAARHGVLLTKQGPLNITRRCHRAEFAPVEEECPCHTCRSYTRSYLHHLFKAREIAALTLASAHNVTFMVQLMQHYREGILQGLI